MSLGFDPSAVPLHQYFALVEYCDESVGVATVAHGVAAAFADEDDT